MRVVLIGLPDLTRSWKHDLAAAGERLGWDVAHLPPHDAGRICRALPGADMLLWARTPGRSTPQGERVLAAARDAGVTTVGVHLDLYWTRPAREAEIGRNAWWQCDFVFTADGGHQREFAARGVNHRWLPPPASRRWLTPGVVDKARWPQPIVFVGTCPAGAHRDHRRRLLTWARARYGPQFGWYGTPDRRVWGDDLSSLYATARIVLAESVPSPRYWSDRVPLTLARGAPLAHQGTEGLADQGFGPDIVLTYGLDEFGPLGNLIDNITDHELRERAERGRALVEEQHLWEHRLQEIEAVVRGTG
ncbi:hypothetical protein ACGGAI_23935 [Streptomyces antibioticus]|uniref:glycosyltransferase family protein n=1 Tax=Streptomyces antibioticus TaxID=1890 RepID=UPI00371FD4F3